MSAKDSNPEDKTELKQRGFRARAWAVAWIPFVLSAVCFLSGFLVVLSPLPLILMREWKGKRGWMMASISNFIVTTVLGRISGGTDGIYLGLAWLGMIWPVSFLFPYALNRTRSFLSSLGIGLLLHSLLLGGVVIGYFTVKTFRHQEVISLQSVIPAVVPAIAHEIKEKVVSWGAVFSASVDTETRKRLTGTDDTKEFERFFRRSLPFGLVLFLGILHFVSGVIVLRINPFRLRERMGIPTDFFQRIRNPEWMLWPALGFGFAWILQGWIFKFPIWGEMLIIGGVRIVSTLYLIQGLSILHFVMMKFRAKSPPGVLFQLTVQFIILVFASIVLVGLGFLDLWFDFRKKLGQS